MQNNQRNRLKEWQALETHASEISNLPIKILFEVDRTRFDNFSTEYNGLLLDYSKNNITPETRNKLIALAQACDLEKWRDRMLAGDTINDTEGRAVLHTALRAPHDMSVTVHGENIMPAIQKAKKQLFKFCDGIRSEKKFTHIVNIGIGGSDLGTAMSYEALKAFKDPDIECHFVSNIDGTHLHEVLKCVEPKKTLFVVASKTFTTQETMTNATSAREWLTDKIGAEAAAHQFIGITKNIQNAVDFGIEDNHIFPIWDWVGGRFSMWSTVGLPLCIAIGSTAFQEFLDGAHAMDTHFKNAPLEQNIPVLLGLVGIWHRNFMNRRAISIVPYDQYLWRFPGYMQQLDMESNGKSIDRQEQDVTYQTGPIVIGETGTNAQHAFFQLLHQGTEIIPCDIIAIAKSQNPMGDHHKKLLANVIAQSKALMDGREHEDPNQAFKGNRPSNTIVIEELTPYSLGMLLALYEHKIFVQGIIWNINSFDQCGVELGKILAKQIMEQLNSSDQDQNNDSSTSGLLSRLTDT